MNTGAQSNFSGSTAAVDGSAFAAPSLLLVRNCQRKMPVNIRLLRRIIRAVLRDTLECERFDLAIYLVSAPRMTELNQNFLRHAGSTDVITFDYAEPGPAAFLHGEIFVCVDEARVQARQFRTTWQSEVVRYVLHGILHLAGYDDLRPAARRTMKREEDRLVHHAAEAFYLPKLARPAKARSPGLA